MSTHFTPTGHGDTRSWNSSPRPKARENAKNIPCRNITIYGYCRNEKDGCMYNHNVNKPSATQAQPNSITNKKLNVDSPSFTPSHIDSNGTSSVGKPRGISPNVATAAPFTPKTTKVGLGASPESITRDTSTEWGSHEIPEFVPQNFHQEQYGDSTVSSLDPFQSYDGASYTGIDDEPSNAQMNPYAHGAGTASGSAFYQQQNAFTQPLQYHLYAPVGPHRQHLLAYQRTAHDFFIPESLRQELQRKSEATLQVAPNTNLPSLLEHFHSLVPLDTTSQKSSAAFGYNSWIYKAVSSKDGIHYALRRLGGFRLTSDKAIRTMQAWKRVISANIVTVHDCFTSRAFGDSSIVFVTDYHPMSKTLAEQHFPGLAQYHPHSHRTRPTGVLISEQILWSYLAQLITALKVIHTNGLSARAFITSKILLTDKNRIRLNTCGILDVVAHNYSHSNSSASPALQDLQSDDFRQLGRLFFTLATSSRDAPPVASKPIETLIPRTYSDRLKSLIGSLVNGHYTDISTLSSSVSDHIISTLDSAQLASDALTSTLARELENGRLLRLLTKLGSINERPEYAPGSSALTGPGDSVTASSEAPVPTSWSETGERYYLKLFRDYVFHQVTNDNRPVLDLGHVIACLNKLDAGSEEKIVLTSRDEQNVFVITYREIRRSIESAWNELVRAGAGVR